MTDQKKARGAILQSTDEKYRSAIVLLTHQLRHSIEMFHYDGVNEINLGRNLQFIIFSDAAEVEPIIEHYRQGSKPVPILIFLAEPEEIADIEPARYPGVEISTIAQARLNQTPDVTLQLGTFHEIIEELLAEEEKS
jgi:hypothetical protein